MQAERVITLRWTTTYDLAIIPEMTLQAVLIVLAAALLIGAVVWLMRKGPPPPPPLIPEIT